MDISNVNDFRHYVAARQRAVALLAAAQRGGLRGLLVSDLQDVADALQHEAAELQQGRATVWTASELAELADLARSEVQRRRAEGGCSMTTKIAQLEQERKRLAARLAELERERAELAEALVTAQASAVRTGDGEAASEFEHRRADLALQAERLSAALAAVDADIEAARQARARAERERLEARLAEIYSEAGRLADRLQAEPTDRATWARLCDLHAKHLVLRRELYGVDILAQPNPCPRGFNWLHPRAGWRAWWAAVDALAFGPERSAEDVAMLQAVGWRVGPPPRTLRAALGL